MKSVWMKGLAFFLSCLALGAVETGEIKGRVTGGEQEGIPGVTIIAGSPHLQGIRKAVTGRDGGFHLPLLPAGVYTLTFSFPGFPPVAKKEVEVRLGRVTEVDVRLDLSRIQEEITVTAPAPLIDKTSTDTSTYFNAEDLDTVPVQERSVVDLVKYTPGAAGVRVNTKQGTSVIGQPSFRGEGEEGNSWILDGMRISGVRMKNSGIQLNYDSLKEVQIISDSFSPEYGSAYGGIINMVTKSGGNRFSGEFSLALNNKYLQASREEQLSVTRDPDSFSHSNWYFNLGGPLIDDRLWFFVSNDLFSDVMETNDARLDYLSVPEGRKSLLTNNLFTKLRWTVNPSHTISFSSLYYASLRQKGGIGFPELFNRKDFSDWLLRFNYTGIINATTYVEAGAGWVSRNKVEKPIDEDLGPAQYYVQDLARNLHNTYGRITDDSRRLDMNVKLKKVFETETFGRHELDMGLEYYDIFSRFLVDFTGKDEDLFPGNGFDKGTKYYFSSWKIGERTPAFYYEYGVFDFVNSARGLGIFFEDKIIWNRVALMAGFRSQTQSCLNDEGELLFEWGTRDFISPRLSLSLDITGDGRNLIKAGWGRFSGLITTMPLGLLNSGAGLAFRTYRWEGPENPDSSQIHNPEYWAFENEQNAQDIKAASSIKPNFLTRWLLEYDRRLGPDWALLIRYVQTQARDLLEVLTVLDPSEGYTFLFDNFEHKKRDYRGVELVLHGKIGSIFFINASYSHAEAKGTNPGQSETGSWSQEEGSTYHMGLFGNHLYIPGLPQYQEIKQYYDQALAGLGGRGIGDEGWYGKLPYSIDHNIKILATWRAPYGLTLSSAIEWISGYHWEKLGYVPFFGGYYSFPEGRGTRTTPGHAYLDAGMEKSFHLGPAVDDYPLSLIMRVDAFNILNSQKPISFVKEDTSLFGQVWGRQQPRHVRATLTLRW